MKKNPQRRISFSKLSKKTLIQINVSLLLGAISSNAQADWTTCTPSTDGQTLTCPNSKDNPNDFIGYENIVINTGANGQSTLPSGYGIYANGSTWNIKNLDITTYTAKSDGIRAQGNANITISGKLAIHVEGDSADGINAAITGNTRTYIGNDADIYAKFGVGLRANLSVQSGGSNLIQLGDKAIIRTEGDGVNIADSQGYAIYAGNRDIETAGLPNFASATVKIGNNSSISTSGKNAHAVYANKEGVIELGSTSIQTAGAGAHGLYAADGSVTYNGASKDFEGGKIYLLGDTDISVANPNGNNESYAIYASGKNAIIQSSSSNGTRTSGKYTVSGDMRVNDLGTIDLHMTNGSSFIGNTFITGTGGTLNLDIAGANSAWQMDQDSQLTNLKLANDAQVYLGEQTVAVTPANQVTLTTENLSGSGHFYVRTNLIDSGNQYSGLNISDKIKVTGISSGNHKVSVSDGNNGGATIGDEMVLIAEIADGSAKFTLSNANGYVTAGPYKYGLIETDVLTRPGEKYWYLSRSNDLTDTADQSANIPNINYLLNYVENQTLLQRMGELRQSENSDGDVWARAYTGKLDSFSDSILSGFNLDYSGVQIGADKKFTSSNGYFYLGGMIGTAEAKANYSKGDGKTTSYHVGLYATYKANNGFYIDGIAKYVHMENSLNTESGDGTKVKGDGNTSGYSIGFEAGKRFYFTQSNSGWYAEPQVQLTFSHQNAATITATDQLRTDLDSFDSTLARVSTIIGYSIVAGKNPVDVYFKTGYVKEFDGQTGYTFNKTTHEGYKLNGNWWDNGIGITAQINKQHNLYLDTTYSTGSKFDQTQINAGYRYCF